MSSPPALTTAAVLRQDSPGTSLDRPQPSTWGQSIQASGKRSGGRARPTEPLTLARFSSWMISASASSAASSPGCSSAAAGRENQARAARSGSEVTGTGPRPRAPAPPSARPPARPCPGALPHLPTAAAVSAPVPTCLGSAAPRRPAPCRQPAPAAGARHNLRTAGPRPAAGFGPDASAAAGTCRRRVLSTLPAAANPRRPACPHAR